MLNRTYKRIYNLQSNTWTLTNQTLSGHPDLGLSGAGLVNAGATLILIGGTDGLTYYNNVYAYNEDFGFYDTGLKITSPKSDMAVVSLKENFTTSV